ncbi:MAG: hypothetical protein IJJ26_09530 [Victivallales bacterium]|nr:hypothetical protein [Victivallales bacterium]
MKTLFALLATPILAFAAITNYIPDGGFENGIQPVFHRMWDVNYMPMAPQIESKGAFEGKRCVRVTHDRPLFFYSEVNLPVPQPKSPWTFSIYLKSNQPNAQATIRVGIYRQWDHVDTEKTVTVGTDWTRHEITISKWSYGRRSGKNQGPVNFSVSVPEGNTVWADAAQWESVPKARDFTNSVMFHATIRKDWTPFPQVPWESDPPKPLANPQPFEIPLFVQNDETCTLSATPLSTGILFPKGVLGAGGTFHILSDTGELPCQFRTLAIYEQDSSILSGQIDFIADLKPGKNTFSLHYDPKGTPATDTFNPFERLPRPGDEQLWQDSASLPIAFHGATARARSINNTPYKSVVVDTSPLFTGPIHAYYVVRGHLVNESRPEYGLLAFSARIHAWKGIPGVTVDFTLENRHPTRTPCLRQASWESPLTVSPNGAALLQVFHPDTHTFSLGTADSSGKWNFQELRGEAALTTSNHLLLHTQDAWRMHPTSIAFRNGRACADLWPSQVRPLLFSPGMAITRTSHLLMLPNSTDATAIRKRLENPPILQVAPQWMLRAGLPLRLAASPKTPVLNKYLGDFMSQNTLEPENPELGRYWYGVFDYGDKRGDGGWSNLESYTDYSLELRGLACGDLRAMRQGFEGAKHYRDMDINHNTGFPHVHSTNHVNGPIHFGHSWIQGLLLHYLLTGDLRSREVAFHASEGILNYPVDSTEIRENRELAYYLMTLSDMSLVFGTKRNYPRFLRQLEQAETYLHATPTPRDTLMQRTSAFRGNSYFWWCNAGIVPFACWYGTAGLLKMHALTHDASLEPHIRREFLNTLDLESIYRVHLEELHPNLPAEQTLPFIASNYVGGRGGYFYYSATEFSRLTGDPKYAELARKVAYARILEGKNINAVNDIMMTAPFADLPEDFSEEKLIEEVRQLFLKSSAPKLLNGDFRQTRSYAEMMTPRVPGAITPEWAKDIPYPRFWHINIGKEYTATEFMRYRTELYSLGDGCMNILLDRSKWYAININMDSARIALRPGVWNFSAKVKRDNNVLPSRFAITFSHFHDYRSVFGLFLDPKEKHDWTTKSSEAPDVLSVHCTAPDRDGFVTVNASFRITQEGFSTVNFYTGLLPNAQKGIITLRELSFEPQK